MYVVCIGENKMAVIKVTPITAVRKSKQAVQNVQNQQPRKVINSFEFQAGFIPPKTRPGHPGILGSLDNVEHYIDSLI